MRRILDRYIFREIAWTWLGVTMVLLLILLTNQFARILGDVAKGHLPKDAAFEVIGLSAAQYMTIIIPIGLFLSIMLALGRLYRDSEMPAMMACRVGPGGIYRPLMWLLVPLAGIVAWLSIDLGPRAMQAVERIGAEDPRVEGGDGGQEPRHGLRDSQCLVGEQRDEGDDPRDPGCHAVGRRRREPGVGRAIDVVGDRATAPDLVRGLPRFPVSVPVE